LTALHQTQRIGKEPEVERPFGCFGLQPSCDIC